jgi:hypothetical protein
MHEDLEVPGEREVRTLRNAVRGAPFGGEVDQGQQDGQDVLPLRGELPEDVPSALLDARDEVVLLELAETDGQDPPTHPGGPPEQLIEPPGLSLGDVYQEGSAQRLPRTARPDWRGYTSKFRVTRTRLGRRRTAVTRVLLPFAYPLQ